MSTLRYGLIYATNNRAITLTDVSIYNDMHKRFEYQKQTVLADKILTNDEKTYAIRWLTKDYDRDKVIFNSGAKRICENCKQECLATLYCEYCVRNYLKEDFSNWTSGNDDIDNLIQKCQMESLMPNMVVEWIPYSDLVNIKYLTKGGFSEIYTADWITGGANQSWFEEVKSHLTISNKWPRVLKCYGLTQNPSNGNYMLVMNKMSVDLRKYLQQNHSQLTWKDRMKIIDEITLAIYFIHEEKAIHRDLHSGNILYSQFDNSWCISDLGFCGLADKPSESIYGNLPYIAPEVIVGREYTFASDIYSIAILMWEISSGQTPFINYEHENDIVMNIINSIRPKIVPGTPLEYKNLMKECWDADPLKRPDAYTLCNKIQKINLYYQNMSDELFKSEMDNLEMNKVEENYTSSRLFTSKIHNFGNLHDEPRNATEEEQEVFHSKLYDFNIPNNIDGFNESSEQNSNKSSKVITDSNKKLSKLFKKLEIKSDNDEKGKTQKYVDDDDEVYNNPNLHSKEQDELEIPDDGF
ncbi:unnamed protein product [Rhizophagus irregularis]|nr:unnamed protein product [Rhizophagus irregularis]